VGELLGGQQEFLAVTPSGALDIPEEDIPVLRLRWPRVVLNLPRLLVMALRHSPRRAVRFIERTRAETEAALGGAWRAGTDTELARSIEHRLAEMIVGREAFLYLGVGFGHVLALFTVCHRWFGPEGRSIANRLLAGLGALEHAEAGLGLWRLAASIAARPVLRAALEGAVSLEAFCTSLRSLEGGAALLAEWSRFMRRFGHHGTAGELELATPRWHERPDQVLDMVRHLIMGVGASDPVRRVQAAAQERDRLVADCRRRLRNPLKRAIFDVALRMARRGAPVRENLRNETVRQIALVRLMVLELGRRLVARGALAQDENVFFLRSDEFVPLLGGEITVPVAERRAEYERNRALHPPALIRGRFAGSDRPDAAPRAAARRLEGISASRGVAIGPARVLLRAGDGHVRPGEILVAPFTDPAWAPHFLLAAAIVMDMGGLLSHGAIVAREYGVPCVVNVGPATSLIATGQMIRVDGDRGVVEVLED
jgi:pyruvate,water dikinase